MSYVAIGAEQDPFKLFDSKLAELRQGKAEEAAGTRPPSPLSTIAGYCWDQPGFKDCHKLAFRAAQADCEAQGRLKEGNACIGPLADHYATACPCEKPVPLLSVMTGNTWLTIGIAIAGAYVMFGMPAKKRKTA